MDEDEPPPVPPAFLGDWSDGTDWQEIERWLAELS